MLKTHNTVVASLALKNMAPGAPLHSARNENQRWNENVTKKYKLHDDIERELRCHMMSK